MYRATDLKLFKALTLLSTILAVSAVIICAIYIFLNPDNLLRDFAAIILMFSAFFQVLLFVFKFNVIEKRLLHMIPPSQQHFDVASRHANLTLVAYFGFFLLAFFLVAVCFLKSV